MITDGWQILRKNRLTASAIVDIVLFMSNAASASNIVSLEDYRSRRGEKRTMPPRLQSVPLTQPTPAVWVYWVPVWVW